MEITITFLSDGDEIFYGCTLTALKQMKLPYKEHIAPGSIRMTITVNDTMDAYYLGRLTIEARLNSFQTKISES